MDGVYDIMIANESYETWKKETLDFTQEYISRSVFGSYSEEEIEQGKQNLLSSVPEASFAWIRYFVMFDPAPLFISISCPVLALNGEKDCQVLPAQNICAIKTGLKQASNTKTKTMILPG